MRKTEFRLTVTYVPFESEVRREQSYRMWVDSFNHIKKTPNLDSTSLKSDSIGQTEGKSKDEAEMRKQ